METTTYRPAGMSFTERNNAPTECGCCGRQGLKATVKMAATQSGRIVWMGTGCAAKAAGVGIDEFKAAAKDADEALDTARRRAAADTTAPFTAFVDENGTGATYTERLASLGGFAAAKAAFKAV